MKKLLSYLILALIPQSFLFAQEFSVKDFFLVENDLTANTPGTMVTDQNDQPCALIKVETTLDDFSFDVGVLGVTKTQRVGGEMWVYVPFGVRRITISHPKMGVIRDYAFPCSIEKARTYILKLNATLGNRVYDSSKKQRMILHVSPSDAKVEINGMSIPAKSNGIYDQEYSFGVYDVIVTASRYHTSRKQVTINDPSRPHNVKISLKPTFGWLKIEGSGDEKLYVDSKYRNHTPNTNIELNSGTYRILLEKPLHKDFSTTVQITDSSSVTLEPEFEPIYRDIQFSVDDDAEIWIDGVKAGVGNYRKKLVYGVYEIECRKENHTPAQMTLEVTPTVSENVRLRAPRPILGRLTVTSNLADADVYVNNRLAGKTPYSVETIIGTYEVTVKKEGYAVSNNTIYVSEGVDNKVYAEMDKSITAKVTSTPDAYLIIDGKALGKTPSKTPLSIGKHKVHLKADGYADFQKTVLFDDSEKEYMFKMKKQLYYNKYLDLGMNVATNFKYSDVGYSIGFGNGRKFYSSFDLMFGLTQTDEYNFTYNPYGFGTEVISCTFLPLTFLFKVGCPLNAGTRFQFCPLAGIGVFGLSANIEDEALSADFDTYIKEDKSIAAFQTMAGFRVNFAITKSVEMYVMPALYYRTKGSELMQNLNDMSPFIDHYGKGFKLHIGLNYYRTE